MLVGVGVSEAVSNEFTAARAGPELGGVEGSDEGGRQECSVPALFFERAGDGL
jgi:hypothetical protein